MDNDELFQKLIEKNLELRKALAEVDRLTALNLELETKNKDAWRLIDMQQDEKSELFDRLRKKEVMLRSHERDITALQKKIVHLESYIEKKIKSIKKDTEWLIENLNDGDPIEHWDTSSRLVRSINKHNEQIEKYQEILELIK